MAWTLEHGGRWCHHASTGGCDAHVQRTADGRRWFASVNGAAVTALGRPGALLTWESDDGARAHVERVLRNQRGGPTFAPFDPADDEDER